MQAQPLKVHLQQLSLSPSTIPEATITVRTAPRDKRFPTTNQTKQAPSSAANHPATLPAMVLPNCPPRSDTPSPLSNTPSPPVADTCLFSRLDTLIAGRLAATMPHSPGRTSPAGDSGACIVMRDAEGEPDEAVVAPGPFVGGEGWWCLVCGASFEGSRENAKEHLMKVHVAELLGKAPGESLRDQLEGADHALGNGGEQQVGKTVQAMVDNGMSYLGDANLQVTGQRPSAP